jgi:putative transposase
MHTYTSIHLHVVFATWNRRPFLSASLRPRVHAYIASTARKLGVDPVHVGGHEDHVHLLGRFDPAHAPSAVIGQIKQAATFWLHEENMVRAFRWQRGFSAFAVSCDRIPVVVRYIERQEEHHRKRTFREELEGLFRAHGVRFEDAHLL